MIDRKDVVWLKVPYPGLDSGLAIQKHKYICHESSGSRKHLVKCQTFKFGLLDEHYIKHLLVRYPNAQENPFRQATVIDCDKLFITDGYVYRKDMLTTGRTDVSDDLIRRIDEELMKGGYEKIYVSNVDLRTLNG